MWWPLLLHSHSAVIASVHTYMSLRTWHSNHSLLLLLYHLRFLSCSSVGRSEVMEQQQQICERSSSESDGGLRLDLLLWGKMTDPRWKGDEDVGRQDSFRLKITHSITLSTSLSLSLLLYRPLCACASLSPSPTFSPPPLLLFYNHSSL